MIWCRYSESGWTGAAYSLQTACHLTVLASAPTLAAGVSTIPPNGCHPPIRVVGDMLLYSQVAGCSAQPHRLGKERKRTTLQPLNPGPDDRVLCLYT